MDFVFCLVNIILNTGEIITFNSNPLSVFESIDIEVLGGTSQMYFNYAASRFRGKLTRKIKSLTSYSYNTANSSVLVYNGFVQTVVFVRLEKA
jgi:hypothetical protein